MELTPFNCILTFVLIWWVVLFAVLPTGIKRDDNPALGNDPGAPMNPRIGYKILKITIISVIIFLCSVVVILFISR